MPSAKAKAQEQDPPEQARTLPPDYSMSKLLFGNQAVEFTRMHQVLANANWLISCLNSVVANESSSAALLKKTRSKIPACPNPTAQKVGDADPRAILDQRLRLSAEYAKALKAQVITPLSKVTAAASKQLTALDKEHTKVYAQLNKLRTSTDKLSNTVLKLYDQVRRLEQMAGLDPKNKAKAQAALSKAQVADGKYRAEVTKVNGYEETLDSKVVSFLDSLEKLDISMCEAYNRALLKYSELTSTYFSDHKGLYDTLNSTVGAKDVTKLLIEFATENKSTTGSTMRTTVYKDLSGSLGGGASSDALGVTNVVVSGAPIQDAPPVPGDSPAKIAGSSDPSVPSAPPAGQADGAGDADPEVVSAPVPSVVEAAAEQPPTAYDASLQGTVKGSMVIE